MMVVRTVPNAAGAEHENSKDSHQNQSEDEQPAEKTTDNLTGQMKIPKRPRNGNRQEKRSGENIPPTPRRGIRRVRLGCQYEFFPHSHIHFRLPDIRLNPVRCRACLCNGCATPNLRAFMASFCFSVFCRWAMVSSRCAQCGRTWR